MKRFLQVFAGVAANIAYLCGLAFLFIKALVDPIRSDAVHPHYSVAWILMCLLYACLGITTWLYIVIKP